MLPLTIYRNLPNSFKFFLYKADSELMKVFADFTHSLPQLRCGRECVKSAIIF